MPFLLSSALLSAFYILTQINATTSTMANGMATKFDFYTTSVRLMALKLKSPRGLHSTSNQFQHRHQVTAAHMSQDDSLRTFQSG